MNNLSSQTYLQGNLGLISKKKPETGRGVHSVGFHTDWTQAREMWERSASLRQRMNTKELLSSSYFHFYLLLGIVSTVVLGNQPGRHPGQISRKKEIHLISE
jgi:hypothetical protein